MILVTGAAGFIGSCLVSKLLECGEEVLGLDNFCDNYSPLRKRENVSEVLDNPKFTLLEMDFRNKEQVNAIFTKRQIDIVVHLGAFGNVRRSIEVPCDYVENNILGTTILLEAASKAKVKHFVFASTSSVYGKRDKVPFFESDSTDLPLAPYPASKKACECFGHAFYNMTGLNFTALRFFNVYGPKGRPDMMPFRVMNAIKHDEEITIYNEGKIFRDWTFIDDILAGIMSAMVHPNGYQIYNLGRGEPVELNTFISIIEDLTNKKLRIKNVPAPLSEPSITYANVDKAHRELGYSPKVSFPEGISRFYEWFERAVACGDNCCCHHHKH